jgi:ABC-type long-subunit fatty acid transport system fused permease/ATPase subunit
MFLRRRLVFARLALREALRTFLKEVPMTHLFFTQRFVMNLYYTSQNQKKKHNVIRRNAQRIDPAFYR